MAIYICPNCKRRSVDTDGRQGLLNIPVACESCGFGFLFELTGYRDQDVMGRDVVEALGLSDRKPADTALEWGVRKLGERLELRTRAGLTKAVTADFFPAYDADGGLLLALAPR